jgi:hypothetical protein
MRRRVHETQAGDLDCDCDVRGNIDGAIVLGGGGSAWRKRASGETPFMEMARQRIAKTFLNILSAQLAA